MAPESHITIRPRCDDDLDKLARILVEVHGRDGYPVEGVNDPYAWLQLDHPLGAWVAELDGQVVGHAALTEPGPHDDAPRIWADHVGESVERSAVLGRLFVSPSARGRSLGARLIQTGSAAAHAAQRTAVLDVMNKDRAAIQTYERLGWRLLGEFPHRHGAGSMEPARAYEAPPPDNR